MIKFKSSESKQLVTYMQIDGEFYKLINPMKIEISLSPNFPRLKVLKNVSDE